LTPYISLCILGFDPAKAASNRRENGVEFADAEETLDDPIALTIDDPDPDDEPRFVTLGMDRSNRILVVVYVMRRGNVRLISAQKNTPGEAAQYHAQAI
jgi:uncharacterized protein